MAYDPITRENLRMDSETREGPDCFLPPFFEAFHPEDIRDILSGWTEVIACSRDTLYEDWRKRSEAYAFCKALEALLSRLSALNPEDRPGGDTLVRDDPGYYLTAPELEMLSQASWIISKSVQASRVICFGNRTRALESRNCWRVGDAASREYFFYVLVLTLDQEKRPSHEVQDLLESRCRSLCKMMVLVHPIRWAEIRLREGDRFFRTVLRSGVFLCGEQDGFQDPSFWEAPGNPGEISLESWKRWNLASEGFLQGASFYLDSEQYRLAAFLLHQATEETCIGLIQAVTGYRITTHNLDRLLRFTLQFTESLWGVFPRDSPEEIEWFVKLQKAYTHARYREGYGITRQEALVLSSRVRRIRHLAGELFLS
ncbi:MAG TPA: HEPN domain-containing protein, partial [Chitinophagaceae bacterium]|nr:HEPN domain-containing protein [Chitinophagaceae bacterium]